MYAQPSLRKASVIFVRHTHAAPRIEGVPIAVVLMGLIFQFVLLVPTSLAELKNCDGVWTNQACDKAGALAKAGQIQERHTDPAQAEAARVHREKRLLIGELTKQRLKAQKKYNFRIDASEVEEYCLDRATSLKDCRAEVRSFGEQLIERVKILREEQEADRKQEEAKQSGPSNVIIVERPEREVWFVRPRKRHPWHGRHPRHPHQEYPEQGHSKGHSNQGQHKEGGSEKSYSLSEQLTNR